MEQNKTYVVFFDLDKTLLTINSGKELVLAAYKKGFISTLNLVKAIILAIIFKLRLKNVVKLTELMAKWLKGISETELSELSKQIVKHDLIYKIRPEMAQEIGHHKKKGACIVLLSAALPYICKPIAKHLEFDDVICSNMETVNNVLTGKPLGLICIEQEKEIRARQFCVDNSYQIKDAYAYGDSFSDRFILKSTGNPICVAPDKKLRKFAENMGWTIMD
ncbi:MAG: hypothetical protein DRJ10_10900 [Bacteroidetes bacterium]|nr:MAG: hypothetical protein DRJ10_10900 [Bacteroidota bacterium]